MKKPFCILSLLFATTCFAQTDQKLMIFATLRYNKTLHDQPLLYKSGRGGVGFQLVSNTPNLLKPILEVDADLVHQSSFGSLDEPTTKKRMIPGVYLGLLVHPTTRCFLSAALGTSLYGDDGKDFHFGIRPSLGFYPSQNKRWFTKLSYTNVFQERKFQNKNFGTLGFALGLQLN